MGLTLAFNGRALLELGGLEGGDECVLVFKCLTKSLDISTLLFDRFTVVAKVGGDIING